MHRPPARSRSHARPRHRNLLRRNRPRRLRHATRGLLAHALHSQVAMHEAYGGVVPGARLARSRPARRAARAAGARARPASTLADLDGIAYTQGPGLAGALLVGASVANALGYALGKPGDRRPSPRRTSALAAARRSASPRFRSSRCSFRAATASCSTSRASGRYRLLGDTQDDAAGEAFDKTAKLLGLPLSRAGPALARLAEAGRDGAVSLPRPMLDSGDLDLSFCGLKTAVLTLVRRAQAGACARRGATRPTSRASSSTRSSTCSSRRRSRRSTRPGMQRLVVAGGVGANRELRARLASARRRSAAARCTFPTSSSAPTTAR